MTSTFSLAVADGGFRATGAAAAADAAGLSSSCIAAVDAFAVREDGWGLSKTQGEEYFFSPSSPSESARFPPVSFDLLELSFFSGLLAVRFFALSAAAAEAVEDFAVRLAGGALAAGTLALVTGTFALA